MMSKENQQTLTSHRDRQNQVVIVIAPSYIGHLMERLQNDTMQLDQTSQRNHSINKSRKDLHKATFNVNIG